MSDKKIVQTNDETKREKLKKLEKVYYSDYTNPKLATLPNWLSTYGHWLDMENEGKIRNHYAVFQPGTVVMINFGVNIGSEMSMSHFAVVLSKKDTKYDSQVIVVPLTSKFHKNHHPANLGNDLFSEIIDLLKNRLGKLEKKANDINQKYKKAGQPLPTFDIETLIFLQDNNFNANNIPDDDEKSLEYFVNKITSIKGYEKYPILIEIINICTDSRLLHLEYRKKIVTEIKQMRKLITKASHFNKRTYADVYNIRSISKLKINKFDKYTISKNVCFNQEILNKINCQLNTLI